MSLTLALLSVLWPGIAESNQAREMTLSRKVDGSDIVLIARVVTIDDGDCLHMYRCAKLSVSTVLKGDVPRVFSVLFDGPIAEADPLCCAAGQTYLFFLKKAKGSYFQSVNGPFGIYRVK
jgi:hypothetical protein